MSIYKNWILNKIGMKNLERKDSKKTYFNFNEGKKIAEQLGIDFSKEKFSLKEFIAGLNIELEHGSKFKETNITNDDPIMTGKIAWAHLKEFPDYYERLQKLEDEAKKFWNIK